MEVSPRGGGNRIAELQDMATGQNLIRNEIKKALGLPIEDIQNPEYDGVWCNYIVHSSKSGILDSVEIDPEFRYKHVKDEALIAQTGDTIMPFTGANASLGTIFLRFDNRALLDDALSRISGYIKIKILHER